MLINGEAITTNDIQGILSQVRQLPGGFTERTARRTDDSVYRQSEAYHLANKGSDILAEWQAKKAPALLNSAAHHYREALKAAESSGDKLIQSITAGRYAEAAPTIEGNINAAIRYLTDAVVLAEEYGAKDFASQYASRLHEIIFMKVKYGIEHDVAPGQLNPWIKVLRDARWRAATMFRNQYGEAVDVDAFRVEQGEVGFSKGHKIGTDFLVQCVCPIIRNPKTGLTAFAHIDHGTDIASLDHVLERLGYQHTGDPLQIRLVGGNAEAHQEGQLQAEFLRSVAGHNIFSLMAYLREKNIDIISSDIMEKDQPSAVVVDPQTFDLMEAIPGRVNPDFFLAQGRAMLSAPGKPLHHVFDLSRSANRTPVLVTEQLAESLNALADLPIHSVYAMFTQEGEQAGGLVAERVQSVESLVDDYRKSVNHILQHVGIRIRELQAHGVSFDTQVVQSMIDAVASRSVYVGENADKANAGLIDFVRKEFIAITDNGEAYHIDWEGLMKRDIVSLRISDSFSHPKI